MVSNVETKMNISELILKLLEEKNYSELKELLVEMNPADISSIFKEIANEKIPLLFRLLPKVLAAETFVEMEADVQACNRSEVRCKCIYYHLCTIRS